MVNVETCHEELPDLGLADEWRVVVCADGVPCARLRLPNPGRVADPALLRALLIAPGDDHVARRELAAQLRRRLGSGDATHRPQSCSVVVCTHRRSPHLAGLLTALGALDPAPLEVLIVDNDPGDDDCRAIVEAAGHRYVREDAPGLNRARATGARAARGELIAFTDDDCRPPPGWLRRLDELFDDRSVAVVTGPAIAHELETPAQVRFEDEDGFVRRLTRWRVDWSSVAPVNAGVVGAGANMIFRRDDLRDPEALFPPELDAGTLTCSGGDTYAFSRILASGRRIVWSPGTWVAHCHRPGGAELHRGIEGYGTGVTAFLTRSLVRDRELGALLAWRWLPLLYLRALAGRLVGVGDPIAQRIAWNYLRGGLAGPGRWVRASRAARATDRASGSASPPLTLEPTQTRVANAKSDEAPSVSVIIPTRLRPEALARCLGALASGESPEPIEVVVVDNAPAPGPLPAALDGLPVRVVHCGGVGPGAARNVGAQAAKAPLLLFLDDDLVPARDLVARHLAAHADGSERVVVGCCPPRPRRPTLLSQLAALWWDDHYDAMRDRLAPTFTDMLTGNMSVRTSTFARIGGFDASMPRREDWEWGVRVLREGIPVVHDPDALAEHQFDLDAARDLAARRREGLGDAALMHAHPEAASTIVGPPPPLRYRLAFAVLERRRVRTVTVRALDALEFLRARNTWLRLLWLAQGAAREQGMREGGLSPDERRRLRPTVVVELLSTKPIPAPALFAPLVQVTVGGRPVASIAPRGRQWGPWIADQIVNALPAHELARVRTAAAPAALDGRGRVRLTARPAGPAARRLDEDWWAGVDRAVRRATEDVVVVTLNPATGPARRLDEAALPLAAQQVALALGAALDEGATPTPVTLDDRLSWPPHQLGNGVPDYVALSRRHYLALGGLRSQLARHGQLCPLLELAERALDAGLLVARHDVPGLRVASRGRGDRTRAAFDSGRSNASLGLRDARARHGRLGAAVVGARALALCGLAALSAPDRGTRLNALSTAAGVVYASLRISRPR